MKTKEQKAIEGFLNYIPKRILLLRMSKGMYDCEIELKYLTELHKCIVDFSKNCVLYYRHVTGELNVESISKMMRCSKRTVYRMFDRQNKKMFCFIQRKEAELYEKYPYRGSVLSLISFKEDD